MEEKQCIQCKKIKKINCKGKCKTCYNTGRWRIRENKLKENKEEYEKIKQHRKKLKLKRMGHDIDVSLKINKAGEGTITSQGYRRLTKSNHPNAQNSGGNILEHVYVMSLYLGRPLIKGETVHHKNGDRLDNRIENLELWSKAHGPGQRVVDKIKWCKEYLHQYEHELDKLKEK